MAHRPTPAKQPAAAPAWPNEANLARHQEYMEQAKAKGLLYPEEEWEERVNRGLAALFGPAPAKRPK